MNQLIIGIAGYAGVGKDFLASALEKELSELSYKTEIEHFAKTLKEECWEFCVEKFGIDPVSCSREEKEMIRDFLVGYAKSKRKFSNGAYWVKTLEKRVEISKSEVVLIADVRHAAYAFDECQWIRNKKNGIVIHVSRFSADENGERKFVGPANSEEKENDLLVKSFADYSFCWKDFADDSSYKPHVKNLVQWLISNKKINVDGKSIILNES